MFAFVLIAGIVFALAMFIKVRLPPFMSGGCDAMVGCKSEHALSTLLALAPEPDGQPVRGWERWLQRLSIDCTAQPGASLLRRAPCAAAAC